MTFMKFLNLFFFRDVIVHLIPGQLISLVILVFKEPREYVIAAISTAIDVAGLPVVTAIIFAIIYSIGFINWLATYGLRSLVFSSVRRFFSKQDKKDIDKKSLSELELDELELDELVLSQLAEIFGSNVFRRSQASYVNALCARMVEISDPEAFYSSTERNKVLWNLQYTLSGSFAVWAVALFWTEMWYLGLVGALVAGWLFIYSKDMIEEINFSNKIIFLASSGVRRAKASNQIEPAADQKTAETLTRASGA